MPPKSAKGQAKASGPGRTKQQEEADELQLMSQLAAEMYDANHKKSAKKGAVVAAAPSSKEASMLQKILSRKESLQHELEVAHDKLLRASIYINQIVPLTEDTEWKEVGPKHWIRFEQYKDEYLDRLVDLLARSLSEPYNCFTYEYFFGGWPDLGLVGFGVVSDSKPGSDVTGEIVATCVSKASRKAADKPLRGYVAMLAVAENFRGFRLGQKLVSMTVQLMKKKNVEEVVLETPVSNERALHLYTGLGFAKTKYLHRYYLDGQDAVRLKLWLKSPLDGREPDERHMAFVEFNRALSQLNSVEGMEEELREAARRAAGRVSTGPE